MVRTGRPNQNRSVQPDYFISKATCKQTQQCGKLLRPCWQRCVKCACVALTILDELCNGSNIVALRFGHHGIRNVLGVVRWLKSLTLTLRNNVQQDLQTDATCIIRTMLCPFARGLNSMHNNVECCKNSGKKVFHFQDDLSGRPVLTTM